MKKRGTFKCGRYTRCTREGEDNMNWHAGFAALELLGVILLGFAGIYLLALFLNFVEDEFGSGIALLGIILFAVSLFFVVAATSKADDYATAAIGVFNSGRSSHSECKFLNVGHREDTVLGLTYQYEAGGWTDIAGGGRKPSGYVAAQLGVQTDGPVMARVMTGPGLITTPDSYLGGYFQMKEDFYLGLRGGNGNTVGIKYMHMSSGGLEQPNVGRDMGGVEVSIPW